MTIYRLTGELMFGTRLKRISSRFLADVARIYKSQNIQFEPSWFPIFYLLDRKNKMSVSEIAQELEITHSAVSQMINVLEKKDLVTYLQDDQDKRIRFIRLTPSGDDLLCAVKPIWDSLKRCMEEMLAERENSAYLLPALDELEEAMEDSSVYLRVLEDLKRRQLGNVELMPYTPAYEPQFRSLILSWFIENENMEIRDADLINDPETMMAEKRGIVILAKAKEDIVGTIIARINDGDVAAHIVILAVESQWRRRQIGKELLLEAMRQLDTLGVETVCIEIDRKHVWALRLFKDKGFILNSVQPDKRPSTKNNVKIAMSRIL